MVAYRIARYVSPAGLTIVGVWKRENDYVVRGYTRGVGTIEVGSSVDRTSAKLMAMEYVSA